MISKMISAVMAMVVACGLMFSSVAPAEARGGRGLGLGIAAGIIGLGVLGAAAHADRYYDDGPRYYSRYEDEGRCYRGPRECHWAGRRCFENRYGDTVCRGGRYLCERPVYCD